MATRLRFSETVAAAVSPAFQSYTHINTVRKKLARADSSTLTTTAYAPDAADDLTAGDAAITQFVSDPMQSGNVFTSGNTLKYALQCLESNAGNNLTLQVFVSVVSNDGSAVQATLRSKNTGGTEMATTLTNRFRSTTLSASYTTAAGDRLVVEFSGTGTPTAAGGVQGHNWSIRRGNSGAGGDLAENETDTGTTLNPWIEFATTITWNDQTVTPGVLSLTLTTFAPTVTATNNKLVTPSVVSLSLSTFAPVVSAPQLVTPVTKSLSLTTFAPTVSAPRLLTPSVAALSLSTFAPSVNTPRLVMPSAASLNLTGFAPTVSTPRLVTPSTRSLSLTTFAPDVQVTTGGDVVVIPQTKALTLTTFVPVVSAPRTVIPSTAQLVLSAFAPVVQLPKLITPTTRSFTLTAFAPNVQAGSGGVTIVPGTLTLIMTSYEPNIFISQPPRIAGTESVGHENRVVKIDANGSMSHVL